MDFLNNPNTIYWLAFGNGAFRVLVCKETLDAPLANTFSASVWGCVNVIVADIVISFVPKSAHFVITLALGASIAHKAYNKIMSNMH